MTGVVEHIHVAAVAGAEVESIPLATAIAGRGLAGDRYAAAIGHWSPIRRAGDSLTLIEAEAIASVVAEHGLHLAAGATRRNVTTRGVRLHDLVGRRFAIGGVVCRATRACEPCSYLDGLLGQNVLPALVHRGGIRADILNGGQISVGDPIALLDD